MEDKNLAHMFLNRSRSHKKNPFILSYRKDNWNVLSWRYARRTVRKLCLGFISLGVKPGDRVALLATNRAKWVFCDLAILSAGGVVVPIQHNSTPGQIRHIVRDSKSRFLIIADYNQLRKFTTGDGEYPDVEKIIVMEMVSGIKERDKLVTSFSEIQMRGKSHHRSHTYEERIDQIHMDDPATINYTTNVEGEVKGIILTHGNIYSNLKVIGDILGVSEEDVTLHSLPLPYGPCRLFGYFSPIYSGGTMVIGDKADMEEKLFRSTQPTIALVVPRNLESIRRRIITKVESGGALRRKLYPWALEVGKRVLKNKTEGKGLSFSESTRHFFANLFVFMKIRSDFGGKMKFCICSGAPLVYKLAEFFHIIGIPVLDAYGMTESSYLMAMNRPNDFKLGTVGKAIPGVKIRLSKKGEIQCRGANVMKEFLDDEQKTIQAVPGDWLSSGDLGEIDEDGFLKITGREKDIIITNGGETIAPKAIENALTINRHIKQASIIGNDRKYVTAIIVPDLEELRAYAKANGFHFTDMTDLLYSDEARTLLELAISEVNKELIKHEALADFIIAESEFTTANNMLTAALRNNRSVIEKFYATQIERMYES
jgi:long-chain acyl-CoA synthetase